MTEISIQIGSTLESGQYVLFRIGIRQNDVADDSVQFCASGDELAEGAARGSESVELGGR